MLIVIVKLALCVVVGVSLGVAITAHLEHRRKAAARRWLAERQAQGEI